MAGSIDEIANLVCISSFRDKDFNGCNNFLGEQVYDVWLEISFGGTIEIDIINLCEMVGIRVVQVYMSILGDRVRAELREQDTPIARKRVARLMRQAGLQGVSRRRGSGWPT